MSNVRNGVLAKAYQNQRGFWSVKLEGDDTWYSTYKDDYTNLEGQQVEFEVTKKGNYWNVAGKVKAVAGAPKAQAAPAASGGYDPNERQASIVLQSSYKTAAEMLSIAAANDALQLGSKKAEKLDILMGVLDELAVRIYNNCSNPLDFLGSGDPEPVEDDESWRHE